MILWGESDPLIEPNAAKKFAAAISGSKLITYPEVGHLPQLEIPQRSAADVGRIFEGQSSRRGALSLPHQAAPQAPVDPKLQYHPRDACEIIWATRSPDERDGTLRGIDEFIEGYLAYETRAERILAAADADPESCMANVYAGMLWMLLEAPEARRARGASI